MAAADSSHAFAVGSRQVKSGRNRTLVEQFDGTGWSVVPSPNRGPGASFLNGVTAIAPNDAWAVGTHDLASTAQAPLVEHWNGTSWSVVPSPYFHHSIQTTLGDVSAVSANDVWAVGSYFSERRRGYVPLTEHWDGTAWSIVPAPSPGPDYEFSGVTALATDDVWAVGLSASGLVGGPSPSTGMARCGASWTRRTWDNPGPSFLASARRAHPSTPSVYPIRGRNTPSRSGGTGRPSRRWQRPTSVALTSTINSWLLPPTERRFGRSVSTGTRKGPHTLTEYVC